MPAASEAPAFEVYATGIVYLSVCTHLSDEEVELAANVERPTGISSRWSIHDGDFRDGTPNGCPCPDHPGNRHVLLSC